MRVKQSTMRQERQPFQDNINVCTRNAFHGQYKLAAGDQQVASTAWLGTRMRALGRWGHEQTMESM
jgi:hypothetical protein